VGFLLWFWWIRYCISKSLSI